MHSRIVLILCCSLVSIAVGRCAAEGSALADLVERMAHADADSGAIVERVRALVEQGADVNAPQIDGMTALHWAAYYDLPELGDMLVKAGARVDAENRYGVRPLSLACENGSTRFVTLLLAAGADPNATLDGGETALMTAARAGRLEPVQALLARGADVNARERNGQMAIMWAAEEGHVEVVDALLKANADFTTPLASGFTPLLFAARAGRIDVARRLIEAGADVNQAIEVDPPHMRSPAKGTSPLILAIENGHFELAEMLLDAGADPNDERSRYAPLHTLTWVRKPNRGDGLDGAPPPDGSGSLSSLDLVRSLIAHGADVNRRLKDAKTFFRLNKTGATPFLMAADTADVPLMRLLIELGADPSIPNADGSTPLMVAAGVGTFAPGEEAGTEDEALEAVKFILELGGDINALNRNGDTAMHGAAYASFPDVVRFLAENGADIEIWNRKNKQGWTPLAIAEGYRPGNFKPSDVTIAALREVMQAAGVTPPEKSDAAPNEDPYKKTDR